MPIEAKRCLPLCEGGPLRSIKEPGDFHFESLDYEDAPPEAIPPGAEGRFVFGCPKGRGYCGGIIIGNGFKPQHGACPTWQWDGNPDKPTLTPSINCKGCWHGWLTAGEFKTC